jgi:D-alanyl-D-alanine carboxypeptidase/D-alanyl-D-alanine-endopeptidase (penicillin-binding protein 4)
MRRPLAILLVVFGMLGAPEPSLAASQPALGPKTLRHTLTHDLGAIGGLQGAYVFDLNKGRALFARNPGIGRIPASVQKLYTTATALLRMGPTAVLTTSVLGTGRLDSSGTWHGTLYLRGGGDPTFGSQSFDQAAYGTGATTGQLARALRRAGVKRLAGRIVGDESRFDSVRGTAPTGFKPSLYLEGQLSALAYDRGFSNPSWTAFQSNPPKYAATQFAAALRTVGVTVPARVRIATGKTPRRAQPLASVNSLTLATLIRLTNAPSDNFLAEMLLKDLGASFGGGGTTASGVGVVHRKVAGTFHIHPRFNDGSGLSRYDSTSPQQLVTLLAHMASSTNFVDSLAVAGKTGTLRGEMRGTRAQGRCRGKTGTLHDVASLTGYCTARDGHTLAFAFLLNGLTNSNFGHAVEAKMAVAVANYNG